MRMIAELKERINRLVQSMFMEEILDGQFSRVQALQDESSPNFVNEVLSLFCDDVELMIADLNRLEDQDNVDYQKLLQHAHKLKGSSACMGAQRIKMAAADLLQASRGKNKEGCVQAVNKIGAEYFLLRSRFHALVQMEGIIMEIEASKGGESSKQASMRPRIQNSANM